MQYHVKTTRYNTTVHADEHYSGTDGFVHLKNGSTTVASVPVDSLEGLFKSGWVA